MNISVLALACVTAVAYQIGSWLELQESTPRFHAFNSSLTCVRQPFHVQNVRSLQTTRSAPYIGSSVADVRHIDASSSRGRESYDYSHCLSTASAGACVDVEKGTHALDLDLDISEGVLVSENACKNAR